MSKDNPKSLSEVSYGHGYLYYPYMASDLEGKMLTFVESLGFGDKQEEAVKSIVRRNIYDFFNGARYVPPEMSEEIEERNKNSQPVPCQSR